MKNIFFVLLLVLLILAKIYPVKMITTIPVPEIINPGGIAVSDLLIYVSDGPEVSIYSLKEHKFIEKFGKKGEGPKEFMVYPGHAVRVELLKDKLMVNSLGKISFFTKDGSYIKEIRTGKLVALKYINGNYIGHSFKTKKQINYQSLTIYNVKFQKIKDLIKWESPIQDVNFEIDMAPEYSDFHVMGDKIYAVPNSEFAIDIFDKNGDKLNTIRYPYSRLKIDEFYKKTVLDFFKTDKRWKKNFALIKKAGKFKTYFPAVKMFLVDKNRIYVQTYKRINEKNEFIIFDQNGKFLKKVFAPFTDSMGINIVPLHTIRDGKMYQLVENEESEKWEIKVFKF